MTDKEIKQGKIRYIPTGIVFTLPVNDAIETLKTDRGNFEIVDNSFLFPEPKKEVETTTYQQVVEDENAPEYDREAREKELKKLNVADLIAICDELKIEYKDTDKKADLISKIIAEETTTNAEVETTTDEQVAEE